VAAEDAEGVDRFFRMSSNLFALALERTIWDWKDHAYGNSAVEAGVNVRRQSDKSNMQSSFKGQ
jgi:hypothetical protein